MVENSPKLRIRPQPVAPAYRGVSRFGVALSGSAAKKLRDRNGDRDAVQHRITRQRVDGLVVGEHVGVDSPNFVRHCQSRTSHTMTKSVRQTHDTLANVVGDLDWCHDAANTTRHAYRRTVGDAKAGGIKGGHLQRAP